MDQDRMTNTANHMAGHVREAVGEFADETKVQAQEAGRRASVAVRDATAAVSSVVQRQPLIALLAAGLVGGLLTLMLGRR